jgi:hypothetical protein
MATGAAKAAKATGYQVVDVTVRVFVSPDGRHEVDTDHVGEIIGAVMAGASERLIRDRKPLIDGVAAVRGGPFEAVFPDAKALASRAKRRQKKEAAHAE